MLRNNSQLHTTVENLDYVVAISSTEDESPAQPTCDTYYPDVC